MFLLSTYRLSEKSLKNSGMDCREKHSTEQSWIYNFMSNQHQELFLKKKPLSLCLLRLEQQLLLHHLLLLPPLAVEGGPPGLPPVADQAAHVPVQEGEGLGEQGAHLGGPHEEERHAEDGVQHRHHLAPGRLGGDVAEA